MLVVSSFELQKELSDETRFRKTIASVLMELRNGVGDGLFTVSGRFAYFPSTSRKQRVTGNRTRRGELVSCPSYPNARLQRYVHQRHVRRYVRHCFSTCVEMGTVDYLYCIFHLTLTRLRQVWT